jgi:hypothetical protein
MDIKMKTNGSNIWPYVVVGSAIGGAIGYLFVTESGRKIRHSITHPDELAGNLEDARDFVENKARIVTRHVHGVIDKARHGMQEGERAYYEAGESLQTRADKLQDPLCELGALFRGVERGVRAVFGRS